MLYVGLVIAWVFLLPGYVAKRAPALTTDEVASHLRDTALKDWNDYKAREQAAKAATRVISQQRPDTAELAKSQLASLTSQEKIAPPFRVLGMANDWLTVDGHLGCQLFGICDLDSFVALSAKIRDSPGPHTPSRRRPLRDFQLERLHSGFCS